MSQGALIVDLHAPPQPWKGFTVESLPIVRQSDLASFSYCAMRQRYEKGMQQAGLGHKVPRLSATVYGSVLHYVLETMQRDVLSGFDNALPAAIERFEELWTPGEITRVEGVDGWPTVWTGRSTMGSCLIDARSTLQLAYAWMLDQIKVGDVMLATEQSFMLPLDLPSGRRAMMRGTIDRLSFTLGSGRAKPPVLWVKDWKTGKVKSHLQYAMQWTIYSWATTQAGFWDPFHEDPSFQMVLDALHGRDVSLFGESGLPVMARRGSWLQAKSGGFHEKDCGFRGDQHFARMRLAVDKYLDAVEGDFAPLTMDTERCAYCIFNGQYESTKGDPDVPVCGDAPMPVRQLDVDVVDWN